MIVIIDYGMGNVASVKKAVDQTGFSCTISASPAELEQADWLLLPGVGAFRDAMTNLREKGYFDLLNHLVLEKKKPFIGVCLGMQVLATRGFEDGETEGFGWIEGEVRRIPDMGERVPHMGWNDIQVRDRALFRDIPDSNFYFMHSYHFDAAHKEHITSTVHYGIDIVSSVRKDNIFAFQFHPEKSQLAGIAVLKNVFGGVC